MNKWKREDITPEILRELLRLDDKTGKLYWMPRDEKWFNSNRSRNSWNTRYSKQEAFVQERKSKKGDGLFGVVLGVQFEKAKIVYAVKTGRFPDGITFPIDGDKNNTAFENISVLTMSDICSRINTGDSSMYFGVSVAIAAEKKNLKKVYRARIRQKIVSMHETPIEAARAYDKAAFHEWGENARLNFPEEYGLKPRDIGDIPEGYFDEPV